MMVLSCLVGICICFGIPIGGAFVLKKRGAIVLRTFLMGALAFFISQICIRLPLLTMLGNRAEFVALIQQNIILYALFLGVSAGVFEEGARLIFMRFAIRRRWELKDGLVFGLGHGGIEAMLLVGVNFAAGLWMLFTQAPLPDGMTAGALLVGGIERLFAMVFHLGASLLVMYGLRSGRAGRYLLLAILLHAALDAAVVILPAVFKVGAVGIEALCAVAGGLTLLLGVKAWSRA